MPHTKIRNKRSIRNTVLFGLCFIYIFIIGLFDNSEIRDIVYYVTIAAIYFSAVLVIADKSYKYFYLAILLIALDMLTIFFDLHDFSALTSLASLLFFLYVIYHLVVRIASSKIVGKLEFLEAINIYLLFGIIGSVLFRVVYANDPNSFNYPGETLRETADFLYFSFVTISTLGYGDITPNDSLAKSLSIFLSVAGQLYLAMIIAMLVGKYLSFPKDNKSN
jgi:hypothetical protein